MPTTIKNPTTGRTPGMLETQVDLNNCREDSNSRESILYQGLQWKNNRSKNIFPDWPTAAQEKTGTAGDTNNNRDIRTGGNTSSRRIFFENSRDTSNSAVVMTTTQGHQSRDSSHSRKSSDIDSGKNNRVSQKQLKGSLTRDFRLQVFFVNQCPPGPWIWIWDRFDFFRKFAEIIANGCCSAVSTTPAIKREKLSGIIFFRFLWRAYLCVHYT